MNNNKRTGGFFGKSYYIALALCAAAIGIVGFLYYQNDESETALQEQVSDVALAAEPTQELVAAVATQTAGDTAEVPATAPTEKSRMKTSAPVSGETVMDYAMDCLSYNETTRDWRTHSGIDIAAEAGTEVRAAAGGTVYTTYNDDLYGATVVIRHEDGYTTQYSSLGTELSVSAGDTVELGQVIGCVGETALLETAIGPHVHFSVTCDGESMDPGEFLALN